MGINQSSSSSWEYQMSDLIVSSDKGVTSSTLRKSSLFSEYNYMISEYVSACHDETRVGAIHASFSPNTVYQDRVDEAKQEEEPNTELELQLKQIQESMHDSIETLFMEIIGPKLKPSAAQARKHSVAAGGSSSGLSSPRSPFGTSRVYEGVFYYEWKNSAEGQLVSNHERRCTKALLDLGIPNVAVPLVTTITFFDAVITAIALVPIEAYHDSNRPGTCVKVHFSEDQSLQRSSEADSACIEAMLMMNYRFGKTKRDVGESRSAQVHRGIDGRLYFIGNADWLPIIGVAKVQADEAKPAFLSVSDKRHLFRPSNVCWGSLGFVTRLREDHSLFLDTAAELEEMITKTLPGAVARLREEDLGDRSCHYLRSLGIPSRFLAVVLDGLAGSFSIKAMASLRVRIMAKAIRDTIVTELKRLYQVAAQNGSTPDEIAAIAANLGTEAIAFITSIAEEPASAPGSATTSHLAATTSPGTDELSSPVSLSKELSGPLESDLFKDKSAAIRAVYASACRRYVMPPGVDRQIDSLVLGMATKRRLVKTVCDLCGYKLDKSGVVTVVQPSIKSIPLPRVVSREEIREALEQRKDRGIRQLPLKVKLFDVPLPEIGDQNRVDLYDAAIEEFESCLELAKPLGAYANTLRRQFGCYWLENNDMARARVLLQSYVSVALGASTKHFRDIEDITKAAVQLTRCSPDPATLLEKVFAWQPRKWLSPPLYMRRAFNAVDLRMVELCVGHLGDSAKELNLPGALRHLSRALKTIQDTGSHPEDALQANEIAVCFVNNLKAVMQVEQRTSFALQKCVATVADLFNQVVALFEQFHGRLSEEALFALVSFAHMHALLGDEQAISMVDEALARAMELDDGEVVGDVLLEKGSLQMKLGYHMDAQETYGMAVAELRGTRSPKVPQAVKLEKKAAKAVETECARRMQRFFLSIVAMRRAKQEARRRIAMRRLCEEEREARHLIGSEHAATFPEEPLPISLPAMIDLESSEVSARERFHALEHREATKLGIAEDDEVLSSNGSTARKESVIELLNRSQRASTGETEITRIRLTTHSSIDAISRRHGTICDEIRRFNPKYLYCFDSYIIPAGSIIALPTSATPNVSERLSTLQRISSNFNVPVGAIRHFNDAVSHLKDDEELPEGVQLYIPSEEETFDFENGNLGSPEGPRSPEPERSMNLNHSADPASLSRSAHNSDSSESKTEISRDVVISVEQNDRRDIEASEGTAFEELRENCSSEKEQLLAAPSEDNNEEEQNVDVAPPADEQTQDAEVQDARQDPVEVEGAPEEQPEEVAGDEAVDEEEDDGLDEELAALLKDTQEAETGARELLEDDEADEWGELRSSELEDLEAVIDREAAAAEEEEEVAEEEEQPATVEDDQTLTEEPPAEEVQESAPEQQPEEQEQQPATPPADKEQGPSMADEALELIVLEEGDHRRNIVHKFDSSLRDLLWHEAFDRVEVEEQVGRDSGLEVDEDRHRNALREKMRTSRIASRVKGEEASQRGFVARAQTLAFSTIIENAKEDAAKIEERGRSAEALREAEEREKRARYWRLGDEDGFLREHERNVRTRLAAKEPIARLQVAERGHRDRIGAECDAHYRMMREQQTILRYRNSFFAPRRPQGDPESADPSVLRAPVAPSRVATRERILNQPVAGKVSDWSNKDPTSVRNLSQRLTRFNVEVMQHPEHLPRLQLAAPVATSHSPQPPRQTPVLPSYRRTRSEQ